MAESLKAVYKCADGRDFPVDWASAEEADSTWFWDAEHSPDPATPLDRAAWLGGAAGAGRARAECGYAETDWFFSGTRHFNGFWFFRERPITDLEKAKRETAQEQLRARWGTGVNFWQKRCEPLCIRSIQELRSAGPDVAVSELIDTYAYGFEQTFVLDGFQDERMRPFLQDELGEEAERTAADLMAGYPSATLEGNQALWELAQDASRPPALLDLIGRDRPASLDQLAAAAGGGAFAEGLQRYLDYYGGRTTGWNVSTPTLQERPELVLQLIRRTVLESLPEPASLVAAAAARREAVIEQLEERFRPDPDKLAAFRARLSGNATHLSVKEGRALWQLTLAGALRGAVLDRGRRLAESGAVADAQDVFFLLPNEIDRTLGISTGREAASDHPEPVEGPTATSASKLQQLVSERKAEHQHWLGATPPESIGGEPAPQTAAAEAPTRELKGLAASRGSVTGRARILTSFEQYDRLASGDVLVCGTTTPSWTPLFGIAAAVVAEGGGVLSHTAIAAREYGIPAVVGVRAATSAIQDGAMITVDGTNGTVRLGE